ncbi:MAG: N-acetylmuramoyl-L-alanine amidase [Nitrosomonas sp.]|nr:MAG: N-acetylmuramoyl-L-alanine amidase [Nitrosomonas sp.]
MTLLRLCLTLVLALLLASCARRTTDIGQPLIVQTGSTAATTCQPQATPGKQTGAVNSLSTAARQRISGTKPLIIIDAGHGGKDLGAVSLTKPIYQEKNLNLATARLLEGFLKNQGYRTIMTRSDDTFLTLEERANLAKAKKGQLFVSVHYNSAPSQKAEGIEVFYYNSDKEKGRTKDSQAMAQAVLDKVIAATSAASRGVKHGNYSVIRNTTMPAILIEGGFMTNEKEMERLKDPIYLKKLALGIAQGIDQYLQNKVKANNP